MPAYNAEKFIKTSIESILNQTYKDFEFIIVNDCSTDKTLKIIEDYAKKDKRIKVISNKENQKIAKTLNIGLKEAQGDFIARMDADDWSYPDRIEKQVKLMEDNPKVVLCSGYMDICDENLNFKNTRTYPTTDKEIRRAIVRYDPISHPASMWRMSELLKTSLYNKNFPICRDYDLIVRISEYGEYQNIPKPLIKYRVRKDSETGKRIRQTQWYSFYIQMKAHFEYGFTLKFSDILFITMRLIATIILPVSLQRGIANRFSK